MVMSRRSFMAGILAAAAAPAFVREIMRVQQPRVIGWDLGVETIHDGRGLKYSDELRKAMADQIIQAAAGASLKLYSGAPGGGKSRLLAELNLGLPPAAALDGTISLEVRETVQFSPPVGLLRAEGELVDREGNRIFSGPVNLREWSVRHDPGAQIEVRDLHLAFDE